MDKPLYSDAYLAEDIEFVTAIRENRPAAVVNAGNQFIREHRPVSLN